MTKSRAPGLAARAHEERVFSRLRVVILPLSGTAVAKRFGGGERDRTDDLLLAKQALSQLSYTPGSARRKGPRR